MGLELRSKLAAMGRSLAGLLDACYPAACVICGRFYDGAALLCEACDGKLREMAGRPACSRCGAPLAQVGAPCPFCLNKGIRPFEGVVRLGTFDEPLRTLIHQIKYHRGWPIAEEIADRLARRDDVARLLASIDRIVAVPLHWRRQVARGYNQAEVVARRLLRHCGARLIRPAIRVQDTPTQTLLTSQQARIENVRHAFALSSAKGIEGQRILLVDDVMTSGATLSAVARCIAKARPAGMWALTLAVADPRRRGFTRV